MPLVLRGRDRRDECNTSRSGGETSSSAHVPPRHLSRILRILCLLCRNFRTWSCSRSSPPKHPEWIQRVASRPPCYDRWYRMEMVHPFRPISSSATCAIETEPGGDIHIRGRKEAATLLVSTHARLISAFTLMLTPSSAWLDIHSDSCSHSSKDYFSQTGCTTLDCSLTRHREIQFRVSQT